MYKIHDQIFHPVLGVCSITDIDTKTDSITIASVTKDDYSCTFPYASIEKIGIREPVSEQDAEEMILHMEEPNYHLSDNPKSKSKELEKLSRSTDTDNRIEAFGYLMYQKYTMKKSGSINDQLLTTLENQLCDEISIVLHKDKSKLLSYLREIYEKRSEVMS